MIEKAFYQVANSRSSLRIDAHTAFKHKIMMIRLRRGGDGERVLAENAKGERGDGARRKEE